MGEEAFRVKRRLKNVPPVRLIVVSFAVVILAGAFLLTLPAVSRSGLPTSFVDALFTATSATCVTGLIAFDTWTHWNLLGQVIILLLIQIGGLGVITLTTGFSLLLHRKLGLRDLQLATENTSGDTINITHLVKMILIFTFLCESAGSLLMMLRFVPQFGSKGIWIAVFTSVSAYCNAGFDILGFVMKDGSLIPYVSDPLICLTVEALIIIGGIGFIVVADIYYSRILKRIHKKKPEHLNFHSTIALSMSAFLIVLGAVLFFLCENNNTLKGMDFGTKLNASLFQSVSPRTAGFCTVDIAKEHDFTKILTVILMFIGASPAGTGGGIKTTTFVVLLATVVSVMKGNEEATILKRRLDKLTVYRSLAIVFSAALLVLITTGIILSADQDISGIDALFEATSGFGTVGLTAGVTQTLSWVSKLAVTFTMYVGRVGPVSLGLALTLQKGHHANGSILPEGKVIVG
ncbi:cation transport protein [Caproiciproducens galactitolivorans]|uniref:Potassium/sodium uptake protein NtpJ n=1 Tax=Caproiciproducens galactitolivorans TaxID=642589 RepID=A0A4Z0XY20_9FIRM|nr:potassium transporter TrkG [Caproiciproducens galactitolivorans]QEY34969.1 cation transport protein [Caproiciproducens galactitolivorans]TGJ76324.1 potassium/sodium uptake protein NtpJ [Caproiciproducens galactitolivorans]